MANGLSLQELHVWHAGSRNVDDGTNVAINSSALLGVFWILWMEIELSINVTDRYHTSFRNI